MSSQHTIIFDYYKGNMTLVLEGKMTLKEMFGTYAKKLGLSEKKISNYIFLAEGKKLETSSIESLTDSLNKNTTILVYDDEIMNYLSENETIGNINNKQYEKRNCEKWERDILDTFQDMAILGYLTKKLLLNTLLVKSNSLMLIDEAIQNKDPHIFILGILGKFLDNLNIMTMIDRIPYTLNEKYKNLSNTVLQFIFNGLIFKKKHYLSFNLSKQKTQELLESEKKKNNFNENIKKALKELYGIIDKDIVITSPFTDKYYLIIILLKDEKITLTKESLMSKFKYIPDLCTLEEVNQENIIEGIILNRCMLDPRGDSKDGEWGYYEKRGGEDYIPPEGWDRYGLNVSDKYDNGNNDWLMYDNRKGEWCVAYSWLSYDNENDFNQKYENNNDIKHSGQKVGKGIYCTQNPEIMEELTEAVYIKGEKYKLGLMLRVNPVKIRCPENNDELWVVEGQTDEIRPYGLLIKKIE